MNIIFLTITNINSIQEKSIYTDLLREFIKNGHYVYIVSPYERRLNKSTTLIKEENCEILKVKIGNIQKTNVVEKGISTILIENNYKSSIKRHFNDVKFDLVLYSTPPITLVSTIKYLKNRDEAKSYLMLKDIFPQNAVDLGMFNKNSLLYKYFRVKEEKLYRISDYIGCMSQANVDFVQRNNKSISLKKIEVCPNSIELTEINYSNKKTQEIRGKYGIPINKTIFIYGGNLGKPQGIDYLIECIKANEKNNESYFVIVGSGTEFEKVQNYFDEDNPENAQLFSQLSREEYDVLANSCDVGLIFLDRRFTIPNFPSRILSYMQASMPVMAATDTNTDIGEVIENGNFGYWRESNSVEPFIKKINLLCNENLRKELGRNSRNYLEKNYTAKHSYEIIMNHIN